MDRHFRRRLRNERGARRGSNKEGGIRVHYIGIKVSKHKEAALAREPTLAGGIPPSEAALATLQAAGVEGCLRRWWQPVAHGTRGGWGGQWCVLHRLSVWGGSAVSRERAAGAFIVASWR